MIGRGGEWNKGLFGKKRRRGKRGWLRIEERGADRGLLEW